MLGTAPILEKMVGASRRVGLSWPNLAAALAEREADWGLEGWAVLWPSQLPRALTPEEKSRPFVHLARGESARQVKGIVALDGSWSQAKALWWRNPWLLKLDRLLLHPPAPSIYGKMRREPRKEWVSTLEAVAQALVGVGEPEEVRTELLRAMRTMVQRVRDAGDTAEEAGAEE